MKALRTMPTLALAVLLPVACGDGDGGTAAIDMGCSDDVPCVAGAFCDLSQN